MTTKSILAVAALALLPVTVSLPAAAGEGDAPMARTWTGHTGDGSGTTASHRRGTAATERSYPSNTSADSEEPRVTYNNDDDGDGDHRYNRHHDDGLDPAEAARIRRAHEESDGHVYMQRDRDDDGTPSYRSGYTTTYNPYAETQHHRHHHWWWFWN